MKFQNRKNSPRVMDVSTVAARAGAVTGVWGAGVFSLIQGLGTQVCSVCGNLLPLLDDFCDYPNQKSFSKSSCLLLWGTV